LICALPAVAQVDRRRAIGMAGHDPDGSPHFPPVELQLDHRHVIPAVLSAVRIAPRSDAQREDGGPFQGWGKGHAWPLLTGDRGHYELAAGRDARPFLRAMEGFASSTRLLPEQVWSEPDLPDAHLIFGRPTGGAMPLVWAHAEYVKLVRSATDGQVFDLIPEVARRYRGFRTPARLEIWKCNRRVRAVRAAGILRIQACAPFRLHWTCDQWQQARDTCSTSTGIGLEFVDIPVPPAQRAPLCFTFFWKAVARREGRDFRVEIDLG
jgi:glucoamylase